MATQTPPPAPADERAADQQWLDRLAGLPGPYTDEAAVGSADAMRQAMDLDEQALQANPELAAATSQAGVERQWQRLQARLDREGLLLPSPPAQGRWQGLQGRLARARDALWPPAGATTSPWQRWPAAAGLAAVLALSAVLVQQQWQTEPPYGDGPVPQMRGAVEGLQHRKVAQPRQSAEAFAQALRDAGLRPGLYRRDKQTYLVDITLDATELGAAAKAFESIGLAARPGFTRVAFDAL